VAGNAAGVVIAVEREVLVVVESCGRPLVLVVALAAIAGDLPVQRICWRLVTVLALCAGIFLQQGMVEAPLLAEALHAGVVAVAGDAILADQLLVEGCRGQRLGDRLAGRRQAPHIGRLVAGDATRRGGTGEGRMAGEAVRIELLVAGNQLAGTHHQLRKDEGQHRQYDQVAGDDELEGPAHDQLQNRKMLMM
jgi:hypothetical protein